jgi:hypothetical protein
MFPSWADYLCGHDGAAATNRCIDELAGCFGRGSTTALENLRGEEAILFLGIAMDGSPLFVHHVTDLGSTRIERQLLGCETHSCPEWVATWL